MAESTLSTNYLALIADIGGFLGYSRTVADWSTAQAEEIDVYLQAGLRQFYYPPSMEGVPDGYEWSFMNPTTTIDTIAAYSTGTLEVAAGICTLSDGVWPLWAQTHGKLTIDSTVYAITSRDSDTEMTVVGDDVTAGEDDWSLSHVGYQDLPDTLGRVLTDFYFETETYSPSIVVVSEARMLALLQRTTDSSRPQFAAVRYKDSAQTEGQRLEVMWWPIPDAVYTLTYRYEGYTGSLTAVRKYPLGGMKYSALLKESCLSMAELQANDERGIHWESFVRLLKGGVAMDQKSGGRYFGPMGSGEPGDANGFRGSLTRHGCGQTTYPVTYKDETW